MAIAKVRINPLTSKEYEVHYEDGDTLYDILEAIRKDARINRTEDFDDHWVVKVSGYDIKRDFWSHTKPRPGQTILFAVVPKSGSLGQTFKQIVVTFSGHIGAAVLGPIGGVLGFAFIPKLLDKLIKPPGVSFGFDAFSDNNFDVSQTSSISNQSNSTKKYGPVPRLYGRHRVYPVVAATPYTDVEADPNTGDLVQYFYGIYDFGFGPLILEDLKIGDTPVTSFNNVETRLVDLNLPASEGYWDDQHNSTFTLYKGDVTQTSVGAVLNANENDSGAIPADYQTERNCATNTRNEAQEVVVTFAFPQGLTTIDTQGNKSARTVDMRLEFAEVGTTDWRDFDDFAYVDDFDEPVNEFDEVYMPADSYDDSLSDSIGLISTEFYNPWSNDKGAPGSFMGYSTDAEGNQTRNEDYTFEVEYYGIVVNQTTRIPLRTTLPVGSAIYCRGQKLGIITSVDTINPSFHWHNFVPATFTKQLFYRIKRTDLTPTITYYTPDFTTMEGTGGSDFKGKGSDGGVNSYSGNQQNLLYGTFRFKPKTTNSIKVRLTRKRSYGGATFQIFDNLTWATLTTRFNTDPILTTERHTFLEIRIKATDQLNGTIQTLNAVCTSVLDTWDGANWVKAPTANPAWIYSDLITGRVNKRRLDKTRLDTDSIKDWADYCDEIPTAPANISQYAQPRFKCNFIADFKGVLSDVINQVTSSAQASLNLVDGKYGVLIDREKTTPIQVFTPRNSWNFSSTREYAEQPDALKVKYVDEGANWEVRERIVYNDGFDATTATEFEELDTFGITNEEQAFRFGRYMLFQGILRQENISIAVDFEHLVCTRGDFVQITQDPMVVGGHPARVTDVTGSDVTIDAGFTPTGGPYGYTFRNASGITTSTMTLVDSNTATLDGALPNVGDLIIWGNVNQVTYDCIVKSITPNDDLSATITLVEKDDAIFTAESSVDFPDYSPQIALTQDQDLSPPAEVDNLTVEDNSYDCDGNQYVYFIDLSWANPAGSIFEIFEVYVDFGQGFDLVDFTNQFTYRYIVDSENLGIEHNFKILAVSSTGSKLSLGEVTAVQATPLTKSTPPSDVEDLFINITNETLTLDWPRVQDCDVLRYFIRYSPSLTAEWEQSIPLTDVDPNTLSTTTQGRTGSYFIKAVDFNGNESSSAATAITSIPELFNLNVIEETNDFPTFPGTFIKTTTLNNELILADEVSGPPGVQQFWAEGEYLYSNFLDLGEIYTVRLQSLIEAEGYTTGDIIANWTTLASVTQLSSVAVSEWDVETYYRGRDIPFSMSTWVTLDSIDPISEGDQDDWTPWRKFTIGDFTARIFQFKLVLKSNQASVSPRVFDAKIRSDMPDRVYEENNVVIPNTGATITYSPAFAGPSPSPNVQITIDDAQSGDYYEFTNKTLEGFDIIIKDKTDTAVERQIDLAVKGYGRKTTVTI